LVVALSDWWTHEGARRRWQEDRWGFYFVRPVDPVLVRELLDLYAARVTR
jgi:hypothetical protein